MFLRSHSRNKDGKDHTYWSLVETVRTPDGPRQKTLCYLGELNSSAEARWLTTVEVFNQQGEAQQLKLFPSHVAPPEDDPQVARVLVSKVRLERTRQFGACYLGLDLWKRLELDRFFEQAVDDDPADVPWSRVAALLAINRVCAPGSELAIEERWYPSTALDDLLGIEEGKINDTRLYRCLDRILPHKTKLERHLKERYGELFGAEFDVLLYDLTSTYVEGAAEKNPMMRRGYSRDHRPDCEQMVIALIVNSEGFPFSYETFDGTRADVSTMETILRMVERKYGKARRIWVFDRGIVSEENLAAIRKRGGQYLVGTPRRQMKRFEAELLKDDWTQVRADVEVKQIAIPQGEATYILCRAAGRLCLVGDTEASAAASVGDRPTTLGQRSGQRSTAIADESTGSAIDVAERRHRAAHDGWTRDPPGPDYRTDGRTEIPTAPVRPHPAGTAEITFKM